MSQRFFRIVPAKTQIPFSKAALGFFVVSGVFLLTCIGGLLTKGLNYGIDFKGGTEVYLRFSEPVEPGRLRDVLSGLGFGQAELQGIGDPSMGEFLIRLQPENLELKRISEKVGQALKPINAEKVPTFRFSEERMYVVMDKAVDVSEVQSAVGGALPEGLVLDAVEKVQKTNLHEYSVRFLGASSQIIQGFQEKLTGVTFEVLQIEQVGEKVGSELRLRAIGAVLISIFLILLYIWFRFDFEYAPGAILALLHDALGVLGIFAFLGLDFNLSTVAAVLTIVGFSINDTIVIYDRIRENLAKMTNRSFDDIINVSINQSLSRTILTSGTLLFASIALLVWGGPITYNFALALSIGVVLGTYSTIFVASPMTIFIRKFLVSRNLAS